MFGLAIVKGRLLATCKSQFRRKEVMTWTRELEAREKKFLSGESDGSIYRPQLPRVASDNACWASGLCPVQLPQEHDQGVERA